MDLRIKGKTALVTGAGRGLGRDICRVLAAEGVRIVATSRTESHLKSLVESLGGQSAGHRYLALDISRPEAPSEIIKYVGDSDIDLDIIVNNVGGNLGFTNPLGGADEWRQVMRLNVEVAIEINAHFIPLMQKRRWGRICHISSIAALENQGPPSYCAAKAALNAYVRSVGRFVSPDNVVLTAMLPGPVFTEGGYWETASRERPEHVAKYLADRVAIGRFGRAEEISGAVAFLCSDLASFCVGTCLLADGGQGRIFFPTAVNE